LHCVAYKAEAELAFVRRLDEQKRIDKLFICILTFVNQEERMKIN
jgi:hypothetical protein